MGGAKAKRMLTATGLMSLLFLSLIAPQVAALGGEASIVLSSISLSQSEQTASSSISYTFEVEELRVKVLKFRLTPHSKPSVASCLKAQMKPEQ